MACPGMEVFPHSDLMENHLSDHGSLWLGFNHGDSGFDGGKLHVESRAYLDLFRPYAIAVPSSYGVHAKLEKDDVEKILKLIDALDTEWIKINLNVAAVLERGENLICQFFYCVFCTLQYNLSIDGGLVSRINTCEVLDVASSCLHV